MAKAETRGMPENIPDRDDVKRVNGIPRREMSPEEAAKQRLSWTYGNLPASSTTTREEVRARLAATGVLSV